MLEEKLLVFGVLCPRCGNNQINQAVFMPSGDSRLQTPGRRLTGAQIGERGIAEIEMIMSQRRLSNKVKIPSFRNLIVRPSPVSGEYI